MDNKNRQRLLGLIALLCIGTLAGDRLLFTPLLSVWAERSERIEELEKSIAKGRLLLDRENEWKARWEEMRTTALPLDKSQAENLVLKSEDRWVNESRIANSALKFQWKQVQDEYVLLDCRMVAHGNLENIARYLYELECDPLPLKLENVEILSTDDNGEKLTLNVAFSGLQLLEEKK